MTVSRKQSIKKNPVWRFFELMFVLVVVGYVVPDVKHTLFPDQMTRLEKMLRRSSMEGYTLVVDRKSPLKILLSAYDGGRSLTTEIFRDVIKELPSEGDSRVFFTYSINDDSRQIAYLTRTRIEARSDLKHVRRLEVTVCGRLEDQHAGVTRFDGHEPVYKCEVPLQEIVCTAAKRDDPL